MNGKYKAYTQIGKALQPVCIYLALYREEGWIIKPTPENVINWLFFYPWTPEDLEKARSFENAETYTQYCVKTGQPSFGSEEVGVHAYLDDK